MRSMVLPLAPGEVSRVSFDYAVTLSTENGEVRIETAFTLSVPGRATVSVDPASVGSLAADLVALLHLRLESAEVTDAGVLSLRFGAGGMVVVEPHEQYEAWTYADRRPEVKAVCGPGGDVTTWGLGSASA